MTDRNETNGGFSFDDNSQTSHVVDRQITEILAGFEDEVLTEGVPALNAGLENQVGKIFASSEKEKDRLKTIKLKLIKRVADALRDSPGYQKAAADFLLPTENPTERDSGYSEEPKFEADGTTIKARFIFTIGHRLVGMNLMLADGDNVDGVNISLGESEANHFDQGIRYVGQRRGKQGIQKDHRQGKASLLKCLDTIRRLERIVKPKAV